MRPADLAHRLALAAAAALVAFVATAAHAQERTIGNERCSVQLVNQVTPVKRDGSWQLDNVPATTGLVRARLYCNGPFGETRGQSDLVTLVGNRTLGFDSIRESTIDPGPTRVLVDAARTMLTSFGDSVPLEVTGLYADRSARRIDGAARGTSYASSNPTILTVDGDGIARAVASGTVLVTAWNAGMPGTLRLLVSIGGDADGDGLPDDYEVLVGLDPSDPLDALGDSDADGLTNLEEFESGSHPFRVDTDGDTIRDGEEVRAGRDGFMTSPVLADSDGDRMPDDVEIAVGSDPTDPLDTRWNLAMTGLEVRPGAVYASLGPLSDGAPRQVTVFAELLGRQRVDVTTHADTSYFIYEPFIAYLSGVAGEVVANFGGETTLQIGFQGYTALVPVVVTSLQPSPIAVVELPAGATDVALIGRVAHVACTRAGLLLVDVLASPGRMFLGALTFGDDGAGHPIEATDVEALGLDRVVVTLSSGELALVDVASPTTPAIRSRIDLGTGATGVAADGDALVVALGAGGLALVDRVGDTLVPRGSLTGATSAVAMGDGLVVALSSTTRALRIIDVSDPDAPLARGGVAFTSDPQNVQIADGHAYVALYAFGTSDNGLAVLDLADPDAPFVTTLGTEGQYILRDLAVRGDRLLGADVFRVNSIVGLDRTSAAYPFFTFSIDFPGDLNGYGIDASDDLVVATAGQGFAPGDRLLIGRYRPSQQSLAPPPPVGLGSLGPPVLGSGDHVKPSAQILAPLDLSRHYRDEPLTFDAWVADDSGAIARVDFLIDDQRVQSTTQGPWSTTFGPNTFDTRPYALTIEVYDAAGNKGRSQSHFITVEDPPRTRVVGLVVDAEGTPIANARVEVDGTYTSAATELDGTFSIDDVRAVDAFGLAVFANPLAPREAFGPFDPVPNGTTDVGVLASETSANDHLVGPLVATPVMLRVTAPPPAADTLSFVEDFTDLTYVDRSFDANDDYTSTAVIATGIAYANVMLPRSAGDGSLGDLLVPTGAVVDLPSGTLDYANVTVHGTLRLATDDATRLRVQGDLSGTGRIEGSTRGSEIIVGGVLALTLDRADPDKPHDIVARGDLTLSVGVEAPGVSICEMSIYTLLEPETDSPTPGALRVEARGDLLMSPSDGAFIGSLGPGRVDAGHGPTEVFVDGDLVASAVDTAPANGQYSGAPTLWLSVAGDVEVDHLSSRGGVGQAYDVDRIECAGDLTAIDITSGHDRGVLLLVGGALDVADAIRSAPSVDVYRQSGDITIDVAGDASLGTVASGDYLGLPDYSRSVGALSLVVGGTLTLTNASTGEASGPSYEVAGIRMEAARIFVTGGSIRTLDTLSLGGDITLIADEVRLVDTTVATARWAPGYDDGLTTYERTGTIYVDARALHLEGATLHTGGTSGGSGDIHLVVGESAWIDASSLLSGDIRCPSDGGDSYYQTGSVLLSAGTSIVFDDGPTELASGQVAGVCSASRGPVSLRTAERVIVASSPSEPIALGHRLVDPPGDPPILSEATYVDAPRTPAVPRGFRDRAYSDYRSVQSVAIDSGADFTELVEAEVALAALPGGAYAEVLWGTTNDPVCHPWQWSSHPAELPPGRYFAYQIGLGTRGPISASVDSLTLRYRRHPCEPSGPACDDGNPCTQDTCDGSGVCVFTPGPDPLCSYGPSDCGGGGGEETN